MEERATTQGLRQQPGGCFGSLTGQGGRRISRVGVQQKEEAIPLALERRPILARDRRATAEGYPAGVLRNSVHAKFVMEMRSGREPGGAHVSNDLPLLHSAT
jgi:hypothetical protein